MRKDLFLQLAQSECRHAQFWREKLVASGIHEPAFVPDFRTRLLVRLAQRFGPRFVLPTIAAAEYADRNKYAQQRDAQALSAEEQQHASLLRNAAGPGTAGGATGAEIGRAEPRHRAASGNNLRAAVLGANDGLVSNFCLIMGIAGAGVANKSILLTGLAGLAAGACSMALGEWLSVTNARELAQTEIGKEAQELERAPQAEQEELTLIFQAKGLPKEDAQRVASELMQNKQSALDTLAREELGIDPAELGGNPWSAAITSFALFSAGAIFPIAPFLAPGGPMDHPCEHCCQCGRARGHRHAHVLVQRPQPIFFRGAPNRLRLSGGGDHLWRRARFGCIPLLRTAAWAQRFPFAGRRGNLSSWGEPWRLRAA